MNFTPSMPIILLEVEAVVVFPSHLQMLQSLPTSCISRMFSPHPRSILTTPHPSSQPRLSLLSSSDFFSQVTSHSHSTIILKGEASLSSLGCQESVFPISVALEEGRIYALIHIEKWENTFILKNIHICQNRREKTQRSFILHEEKVPLYKGQVLVVGLSSCWGWLAIWL